MLLLAPSGGAAQDGGGPDGGTMDADAGAAPGREAEPDATPDATPDAEPDAEPDATPDATPDAEPDATPDATAESESAREPDTTGEPEAGGGAPAVREPGEPPSIPRRAVPSYDGRQSAGLTVEEGLLWIPRVLFFPLHLVFEYVLRQPIGWFISTIEQERIAFFLVDFFTWDEQKSGLVPTAFFDFGFQPSLGIYLWWNDFLTEGNSFRAQVGFGGEDWLRATVSDRIRTSAETEMGVTIDAWRRPDYIFEGLGSRSRESERSRYTRNIVAGRYEFWFRPWRSSEIHFAAGVDWNDFQDTGYAFLAGDDRSLQQAVAQGLYEVPPGFDGYTAYRQRLDVVIDSREPRPAPGHGVRIEAFAEQGFDLTSAIDRRWMGYGGTVGGFLDLGDNRVLGLYALARFADPLGEADVPFTEQVHLGGDALFMSGFLRGQLIDRSAVAATLEYRYPLWVFLDGSLHLSVGNVFSERLGNFDAERLRMSFGIGFRSIGDRDQAFNVLLAFGSTPFDEGLDFQTVRIVIGSQQGF